MPIETHSVPDAPRHDLVRTAVDGHPQDRIVRIGFVADVAGSADRHMEPPVRPEADELPAVVRVGRQPVRDHDRPRRRVQPVLDAVVPEDPADLSHVETSVAEGHAVRRVQTRRDAIALLRRAVAVRVDQGVDDAGVAGAHEHRTARTLRQRTGAGYTTREHADREPVGQLDLGQPRHLSLRAARPDRQKTQNGQQEGPTVDRETAGHRRSTYQSITATPAAITATVSTLRGVSGSAKKTRPRTSASEEPMPRFTVSTKPTQAC